MVYVWCLLYAYQAVLLQLLCTYGRRRILSLLFLLSVADASDKHQLENTALWHHVHVSLHILTKPRGVAIANNFQKYHTSSEKKMR